MGYVPTAKARDTLIVISFFSAVAVTTAILRFRMRKAKRLPYGLDDFLMLGALFSLFISIGIQYACIFVGGVGLHMDEVAPDDVVKTLKMILPFEILYGVTLCFAKTSVVVFYLRIFGGVRGFRISAYIAIVILVMWAVSVLLETLLLCRPLAFNWDTTIPSGVCGNKNNVYVSAGSLNVITDFMVMGLPIPHIMILRLPMRKKIGLIGMFTLGVFITAVSIIRIKSLQAISFSDPTFTLLMGLFWTVLEPCFCIINSNLPMVSAYLGVTFFRKSGGASSGNTGGLRSGDSKFSKIKAKRALGDSFEMLGDGVNESTTRTVVKGGGSDVGSEECQNHLSGDGIMMTKSINIKHARMVVHEA